MESLTSNQNIILNDESDTFYCIRAFAMLSAVAAHVNSIIATPIASRIVTTIWAVYSRVGVPWFLILSGFFFRYSKEKAGEFWKKKGKSILIPWVLCGICTYGLNCILEKNLELFGFVKWIFGYGTWYYYMTVLLMLYGFFSVNSSDIVCLGAIGATILSVVFHQIFGGTKFQYLNGLNWIGFFAVGILMRRYRLDRILRNSHWIQYVCIFIVGIGVSRTIYANEYGYFYVASMLYEVASFPIILKLCRMIASRIKVNHFVFIGQQTLFIYLLHMQVVQAIGTRIPAGLVVDMLYPIIALEIMVFVAWVIIKISSKSRIISLCASCFGLKSNSAGRKTPS